jgi:outer membrane lipoprotein carrier protein
VGQSRVCTLGARFCRLASLPLFLLLLSTASGLAISNTPPPSAPLDATLNLFESRYRSAKTLSARFLEEYSENGRVTRKEAGTAYFLRPGRMRWEYDAPEKSLFLVDGKYAWFFAPSDRIASRVPEKSSEDWRTPLALLTTNMKLSRVCSEIGPALEEKPVWPENRVYRCIVRGSEASPTAESGSPKHEATQEAYFEITLDGELSRILIREQGGIRIEFRFKNWQWNPTLDNSLFRFKPPMGVAIVDGQLPDSPAALP